MNTANEVVIAAEAVTKAKAALDELLRIKALLKDELPVAREALARAEKQLHKLTRPDRSAIRAHELAILKRKLEEVQSC